MIPKELLPYYTHLAFDADAPEVYVNASSHYRDSHEPIEYKYQTDQQGYSLLYSIGGGAAQMVEVKPPYRYTYGINSIQGSASQSVALVYPAHVDPDYPEATRGSDTLLTAPTTISSRACSVTATASVSGFGGTTLYIGDFVNESREVLFTNNPINLNVHDFLFFYSISTRDGSTVYQPGRDFIFDSKYQSITFEDTVSIEPYTPLIVKYGAGREYIEVAGSGTYTLPPAFTYAVAANSAQGTSLNFSVSVNWTSVIDSSEPSSNYVLNLSDETGCRTLASSSSNNIAITDVNALVHRSVFNNFTDSIRVSCPVPVDSSASLAGVITYSEVEILSSSVPGYNESREVVFDTTVDNPVNVSTVSTTLYSRNPSYEDSIYRAGAIRSLPKAAGIAYTQHTSLVNNEVPASITSTFSLSVPANDSGYLAKDALSDDMSLVNPVSAAWGMLLAAGYKDSDMIIMNLKALLYQAKSRGWIKLEDDIYVIDTSVSAGLPIYFSLTDPNYVESFKEISTNSFLGWASCIAILSLTDDQLRAYYSLQGTDSNFYTELLVALEALATFVANAVSRVTWYAAYKEEDGIYSYDQPSLSATVYADMFLSYFLTLRYNYKIHYVAAKLHDILASLPTNLASPFFDQFLERDYTNVIYPFDEEPSDIREYYLDVLATRAAVIDTPIYFIDFYYKLKADTSRAAEGQTFKIALNTSETDFPYPYTISGVLSSDIDNAPLTGSFSYNGEWITFTSTCPTAKNLTIALDNSQATLTLPLDPLEATVSTSTLTATQSTNFTITFSTNLPGEYPYTITGVTSDDISGAPLSGIFANDNDSITFNPSHTTNKTFTLTLDGGDSVSVTLEYVPPPLTTNYYDSLSAVWPVIEAKTSAEYDGALYTTTIVDGKWQVQLTYGLTGTAASIEWGKNWSYTPANASASITLRLAVFMEYVFNTDGGGNAAQGAKTFPVTLVATQGAVVHEVNTALSTGEHIGYSKMVYGELTLPSFTVGVPILFSIKRTQEVDTAGTEKVTTINMSNLNVTVIETL